MIEFTLSPDESIKELSSKLDNIVKTAPNNIQNDLKSVGQSNLSQTNFQPSQYQSANFKDGKQTAQGAITATAGDLEGEFSELKSGRFSGLFEKRIQGAKDTLDNVKDKKIQSKSQSNTSIGTKDKNSISNITQNQNIDKIKSLKVEKLELSQSASREILNTLKVKDNNLDINNKSKPIFSANKSNRLTNSTNRQHQQRTGKLTSGLGGGLMGIGATLPLGTGVLLGAMGAGMKMLSGASGMYQNLMQGQQGTLGSMQYLRGGTGLVVPGGSKASNLSTSQLRSRSSRLVRNSEMAQIYSARARLSDSGKSTAGSNLGIKFGLAQGMGGLGGATLFGELGRYGTNKQFRNLLGASKLSGMGGLRQAEFFRNISGMAKQGVNAGFGKMDIKGVSSTMAGLGHSGLQGERAMSLTQSMHNQFQQKGSTLNSLALVSALGKKGTSIVEAMAQGEKGATRKNISGVSKILGLNKMDKETRQLLEMNVFGATATDVLSTRKGIAGGATSLSQSRIHQTGQSELGNLQRRVTGQDYIKTQNVMDSLASTMKQSFDLQQTIAEKMTGVLSSRPCKTLKLSKISYKWM